ncbi:MAG: hypothetical protein K2N56_04900 [Oscillospiraceae bacterium]|nr:hypothetical protein [Oscillospiraceae bacterium]
MTKFHELRERHPRFVYQGFSLTENALEFDFRMDEHSFHPRWEFTADLGDIDRDLLNEIAFSLGMAELVSYWKCACPPTVEIRCGSLGEKQIRFWKTLYYNGLAEFFYRNGINTDFENFMKIESTPALPKKFTAPKLSGALVPVGGGKDSVVTLEILKILGEDVTPYIINARGATLGCVEAAGIPTEKAVTPKRTINKHLLELNAQGYLNGHTPYSAVVAFSSLLFAVISGKRYIALSNESSANETYVDGAEINHQYSKSTAFERDFREYCRYTFGDFGDIPEYFSLLRPLSEWQIAREFIKYPRYFGVFQSCNLGSKTNVWCCNCAKCLYVYILLAAFLDDETLITIFGCNMLEKTELAPMLDGLMLDGEDKPFECVGTKDEVRLSLKMALDRRRDNTPVLLKRFEEKFPGYVPVKLGGYFDEINFVPEKFLPYLEKLTNGN